VNGRLCFLIAGIGPDACVVREVHARRSGPMSQWAYFPAALRVCARFRPARLRVEIDGEELPGSYGQVLASNLVHYGGLVLLSPNRVLGDGRFEVFLFRGSSLWSTVLYVVRGLLRMLPGGSCAVRLARHLRVTSDEPVPFHVDGDPAGVTPVEVEVTDQRFELLVP
jgi:diacylglycerol kinase family enzyme